MATNMDRSLDEILADRKQGGGRGRGSNGGGRNRNDGGNGRRRERRDEYPRDGVRKAYRDESRKIDEEWVHDRFDGEDTRQAKSSWGPASPERGPARGTKVRVENVHYELTKGDLEGLFRRIGPVLHVELVYDRAGRSDGVAYVTYELYEDAKKAIAEFDGANAKGQPIRLSIVGRRDRTGTGRPLAERISRPRGRGRDDDDEGGPDESMTSAARRGIDRYVPHEGEDRSRSPLPRRREGGRRPGERRGGRGRGDGDNRGGNQNGSNGSGHDGGNGRNARPKKTQEELDAEMEDYFVGDAAPAEAAPVEDDDMIG